MLLIFTAKVHISYCIF